MIHSMASDLGLHCLPVSLLWDRHKWINQYLALDLKHQNFFFFLFLSINLLHLGIQE